MRSSTITTVAAFALGAIAAPGRGGDGKGWYDGRGWHNPGGHDVRGHCIDDANAMTVAEHFKTLINDYSNASADAYLTTDFMDYSDSVITLIDSGCTSPVPLGTATFDSLSSFEAGQGGQPNIPFEILNVWHGCDTVTLRWKSPMPNPNTPAPPVQEQVQGIVLMETTFNGWHSPVPFLINTVYSEFNSGAWLVDLKVFEPSNCSAPVKRSMSRRMVPAFMGKGRA